MACGLSYAGLVGLFVENKFALNKILVLRPPSAYSHRQLQAAAVILASDRSGQEPEDMRSTLPAAKAWEVLMGSFFGDAKKAATFQKLVRAAKKIEGAVHTPMVAVDYPVPHLSDKVRIVKGRPPSDRPASWIKENMIFPVEAEFRAAFANLMRELPPPPPLLPTSSHSKAAVAAPGDADELRRLGLSEAEMIIYGKHWQATTSTVPGLLPAKRAAAFFQTSNLATKSLQTIWRLSDTVLPKGKLSRAEFYTALKLISLSQNGKPATTANLRVKGVKLPTFREGGKDGVVMKVSEAAVYQQLWSESSSGTVSAGGADPSASWLSSANAVRFFQTSGLGMPVLRKIWTLSDTVQPRGSLSRAEFNIALKLIGAAQAGMEVTASAIASDAPLPSIGSRAAAAAVGVGMASSLGLTDQGVQAYQQLWCDAWGDPAAGSDQLLLASKAAAFFQSSGLGNTVLQKIWRLSDTVLPKGKLSQAEFYTALKLISLSQMGKPIEPATTANLRVKGVPLPVLKGGS